MNYFDQKKKDVSILRSSIFLMTGFFTVILIAVLVINYKEKKSLTSETWAFSPETGNVMKMTKIPFTMEERKAEYKSHVRDFLSHWYQFDQYTFIDNTNYGANLIDKKTREIEINKYREVNTLAKLQERDIILSIVIKDISVDITQRPVKGQFSFEQTLRTSQNLNKRIIEGTFEISDTEGRSYQNPHAALISNFQITRKEDLIK